MSGDYHRHNYNNNYNSNNPNKRKPTVCSSYSYDDDVDKVLTKSQIKKLLLGDQSKAEFINQDLSNESIQAFMVDVLVQRGQMNVKTAVELMLDVESVQLMRRAFTHWSVSKTDNYETLETLGDTTFNKIVAYYLYRRFPHLHNDNAGNYKLSEASKLFRSKQQAAIMSDKLGLSKMARYRTLLYTPQPETYPDKVKQITMDDKFKTDLFEAFVGAVEDLIDSKVYRNTGYPIVYNVLTSLLDEMNVTVELSETKTNKAKLKEVIERINGTLKFIKRKDADNDIVGVTLYITYDRPLMVKSTKVATSSSKFEANVRGFEQACDKASADALIWLNNECDLRW